MDARKKPSSATVFEPEAGLLDFHRLAQIALRRWWLPALGALLGIGAGVYYLSKTPRMYVGVAVVQVEQEAKEALKFDDGGRSEDFRSPDVVKTFEQVLSNGSLLLDVIQVNGLDHDPNFAPPRAGGTPYTDSELIERMSSKVSVEVRRGTRLIDLRVEDRDPKLACQLATSLVQEYFRLEMKQKTDTINRAGDFLRGEEKRLRKSLEDSETELAAYRAKHQAVSLEQNQNIVVEKLRELNAKVTEAKSRRLALEADIARINLNTSNDPEQLLQLASVAEIPTVADLRRQINAKEGEFAAIKERYMYKHSKYIEAQSSLEKLRSALNVEVLGAATLLKRSYQAAQETEVKLEAALHDQEQLALDLDGTAIPYNALLRQNQTNRTLYENVLTRMKETMVGPGTDTSGLRLVQAPTVPFRPFKPTRSKVLGMAILVGGFLGSAVVLVLELTNHTLQTVDQAERVLGLPLLAAIPELKRAKQATPGELLIGTEDTLQREAFRTLRTTLSIGSARQVTRSFLFTSAVPGEGKSFCSMNFAVTLAKQGCQTLFIAGDLRRTSDYTSLMTSGDKAGLGDCLATGLPLAQAVHPTSIKNLFFCPGGSRSSEPAGMLSDARFKELLVDALQVFDRVVIDTPPINAVSDALLMAPHAEAVCLVTRAGKTPINAILRACRSLARVEVTPAGFVMNRLTGSLHAQATYYYGQLYGSAEGAHLNSAREGKTT